MGKQKTSLIAKIMSLCRLSAPPGFMSCLPVLGYLRMTNSTTNLL